MAAQLSDEDWMRIARGAYDLQDPVEYAAARGLFKGGEEILQNHLGYSLLDVPVETVIAAGLRELHERRIPLLGAKEVAAQIRRALDAGEGFSLIRFGDGELFALSQDTVLTVPEVKRAAPWLRRSGVSVPDYNARDQLAQAFEQADLVGVPTSRFMTYGPMFMRLAAYYGWSMRTRPLTSSVINYMLYHHTNLYPTLLRRCKVLLIGNRSKALAQSLKERGISGVVGHVEVDGVVSVASVLEQVEDYEYDVALVAAGIAACLICPTLGKQGKIAIDFGHLSDQLIDPALNMAI